MLTIDKVKIDEEKRRKFDLKQLNELYEGKTNKKKFFSQANDQVYKDSVDLTDLPSSAPEMKKYL